MRTERDPPRAAQIRREHILVELRELGVRLLLAGDRLSGVGIVAFGGRQRHHGRCASCSPEATLFDSG